MSENRRRFERQRMLRRGKIVFRKGYGVIDCVLLDLSAGGARLRAPGMIAVPDRFELRIDNGPTYMVEVAFRGLDATGVRFIDAA